MAGPTRTRIVIIGAGFGGIGLGIGLRKAGLTDFVILERSDSVGGAWRANTYPGAACDVPSHLYSFSFAPKADWPEKYASQADILRYLVDCAREHGLEPHVRLNTEVTDARFDQAAARWIVRTRDGVFEAQSLVSATGQLSRPLRPQLPGIESFSGPAFHSAEWRHDHDLTGRRVAVIGTGASAIQFIPAIASKVEKLTVFQRSAAYVLPKPDKTYPPWQRFLFRRLPGALRLSRALIYLHHEITAFAFVDWPAALRVKAFRRHLQNGVKDPERQRRLLPHYRIGCKRILLSNDFYPAMDRANVEVVTESIREVRSDTIVTLNGSEHKVDCIIFGTGFTATEFLGAIKVTGAGKDLRQCWREGAQAHLGITVTGFPNFFMLYGPNTNLAHNSIVYMLECQIRYVVACLRRLCGDEIRTLEVRPEVQERFNARLQARLKRSVWAKGCTSWYQTAAGRNTNNWPGYTFAFDWKTRTPRWDEYVVR
jgi:cation diffusion facilitator CzcD-associated flavoprotein CzcO